MLRFVWAVLVLALSGSAIAQEQHPLVGTWKPVSSEAIVDGEAPETVFSNGYLIVTREGRVMALFTADGRKGGMGDAERAALHKSMVAVSGKYRVEGNTFTIAVDVSWNESWNGMDQRRHFKIEGSRLLVETDPGPSITHPGKTSVAKLVFDREK
jgi:hypothetical protein